MERQSLGKPAAKRPVVELSDCIHCGVCVEVYPTVFKLNATGYVEVADLCAYPEEEVNEAIMNCPAGCIYWDES